MDIAIAFILGCLFIIECQQFNAQYKLLCKPNNEGYNELINRFGTEQKFIMQQMPNESLPAPIVILTILFIFTLSYAVLVALLFCLSSYLAWYVIKVKLIQLNLFDKNFDFKQFCKE